jgi:hypothetical protein
MAGAPMFQAVQHPELDTLGQEDIRDFMKKRARYLWLVAQNNKADGVNVTPITVVASIDPELLENLIDMEEIDAESVDDCTDECVMEYLDSTQQRSASVTAEYVKAEVLAKVSFAMSEKDPALRVTKAVAEYYSLHRNLRLDFINGKPKKAVEHLVLKIKPATLKALIESKQETDISELKKDCLELVGHLKKMAMIHEEHYHVVKHKKIGDSGMKNSGKSINAGSRSSGHNFGESAYGGGSKRRLSVNERNPDMKGRWNRRALEIILRESRRHATTQRSVRARSTSCLTVLTLGGTKPLSCYLSTRRREVPTRRRQTSKLWATTERRRKT